MEKSTASTKVVISLGAARYALVYVVATCSTMKADTKQAVNSRSSVTRGRSLVSAISYRVLLAGALLVMLSTREHSSWEWGLGWRGGE